MRGSAHERTTTIRTMMGHWVCVSLEARMWESSGQAKQRADAAPRHTHPPAQRSAAQRTWSCDLQSSVTNLAQARANAVLLGPARNRYSLQVGHTRRLSSASSQQLAQRPQQRETGCLLHPRPQQLGAKSGRAVQHLAPTHPHTHPVLKL